MKTNLQDRAVRGLMLWAIAIFLNSASVGQEPKVERVAFRSFYAEVIVFSVQPGDELDSYQLCAGGGFSPNGKLGLGIGDGQRGFLLSFHGTQEERRFLASVSVEPSPSDKQTQAQTVDYDLTDLSPRSLEIARNPDGRVYRLRIVPRVHVFATASQAKQFDASEQRLESWSFNSSPVFVNDRDFVGHLSMSGGEIAYCDIAGVAHIEFSLHHLQDAIDIGTLQDGVIQFKHKNGVTVKISNVRNGANGETLIGGPYRVWARWSDPTYTAEQYRELFKQQLAARNERIKQGDFFPRANTFERLEEASRSAGFGLTAAGVRGVEPDDLVETSANSSRP